MEREVPKSVSIHKLFYYLHSPVLPRIQKSYKPKTENDKRREKWNLESQVLESRVMSILRRSEPSQQRLVCALLRINKVVLPFRLKAHKRPLRVRITYIRKLQRLRRKRRKPSHHLHLKSIRTRLPPQLVNVRADKPVESSGRGSAEEDHGGGNRAFHDHVESGRGHEGDDRAEGDGEAAGGEGEEFDFLYG